MHRWTIHLFVLLILLQVYEGCVTVSRLRIRSDDFITCNHGGINKKYPMYWSHNGKVVAWINSVNDIVNYRPAFYSVSIDSLRFNKIIGFWNTGIYGCFFPFQTSCLSGSATLEISLNPVQLSGTSTETISLDCKYEDNELLWFKNNDLIAFHNEVLLHDNTRIFQRSSRLFIQNGGITDAGLYECRKGRLVYNRFNVTVDNATNLDGNIYDSDFNNVTFSQTDKELLFRVNIQGSFDFLYIKKNDAILAMYSRSKIWFLEPSRWIGRIEGSRSITYVFEIKNKVQSDGGNYSFVLIKDSSRRRQNIEVTIPIDNLYTLRGERAELSCRSNNQFPVYWKKNGDVISIKNTNMEEDVIPASTGMNILIWNVSTSSEGLYQCWQEDKLWSISLQIQNFIQTTTTSTTTSIISTISGGGNGNVGTTEGLTMATTMQTTMATTTQTETTPKVRTTAIVAKTVPTTEKPKEKEYKDVYIALGSVAGFIVLVMVIMVVFFTYLKRRWRVGDTEMQHYYH